MKSLLRLSIICLFVAACAAPNAKTSKDKAEESKTEKVEKKADVRKTECKSNSDIRVLEITDAEGSTFDLKYTKFNETKSIASGSREHCEKIRDRVQKNLENAGFSCS